MAWAKARDRSARMDPSTGAPCISTPPLLLGPSPPVNGASSQFVRAPQTTVVPGEAPPGSAAVADQSRGTGAPSPVVARSPRGLSAPLALAKRVQRLARTRIRRWEPRTLQLVAGALLFFEDDGVQCSGVAPATTEPLSTLPLADVITVHLSLHSQGQAGFIAGIQVALGLVDDRMFVIRIRSFSDKAPMLSRKIACVCFLFLFYIGVLGFRAICTSRRFCLTTTRTRGYRTQSRNAR